jgi:hypothetical protein
MNITEEEQEEASKWFSEHTFKETINLYYYSGETNMGWLFHALSVSKGVYLNCNNDSDVTKWITSYVLSKPNVWYKATDESFQALMSYINQKPVDNITKFLEVTLG